MNCLISIIVPCYNAEKYLRQCLDSLIAQTYHEFEVLVVDDGSSDSTKSIAVSYAERDSRFIVLSQANRGVSAARNLALSHAKGDYLMFVDSDDWVDSDGVELFVDTVRHSNADVVVCEYAYNHDNGDEEIVHLSEYEGMSFPETISDNRTRYYGVSWNKLVKRNLVTSPFHEDFYFYENLIFLLENCREDTKYVVLHKPIYHYRVHDSSATHELGFNQRKLTALEAAEHAMKIVPKRLIPFYEYAYLKRLCWIICSLRADGIKLDLTDERKRSVRYLAGVIGSKDISVAMKAKALVFHLFPTGYYLYLKKG